MATESEPAKLLLPYLQRADELQKHEPLVAYYCRLYAMERGLKIPQNDRTKTTNALLVSLMKQLEKDKKSLKLGPDDNLHVEGFAQNVFAKADKQDRAGRADLNTAKTFYAASIFFEILNQFGEVDPELVQKQKYAVWKAADIRKALKEGKKPQPGPPGGDKDLSVPSSGEYDLEPSSSGSTIRYNPNESSAAVTPEPDPNTLPGSDDQKPNSHESYDNISPPNISRQPSNISHSPSVDPHNYPQESYPSNNFHQIQSPPPTQHSAYSHSQPYYNPHQQQFTHQDPSHDVPSYSYPNFQSYPSFTESSLPSAPSHSPTYYQNDSAYANLPPETSMTHPSSAHYDSSAVRNETVLPPKSHEYEYNSNYQPPPEKISEAHKAARFAVGALAFDDVVTAVEHLKKSLELLTNPSAGN